MDGGGGGYSEYSSAYQQQYDPEALAAERSALKARSLENRRRELELESHDAALKSLDKIGALDPSNMDFEHDYEKLMGDPHIHLARIGEGKSAVEGELARKLEQHKDHIDTWNKIASNYHYQGDIRRLPVDKNNRIDWEATLPIFQNAQAQHYARVQQAREENAPKLAEAGYAEVQQIDPETGKAKFSIKKLPSTKPGIESYLTKNPQKGAAPAAVAPVAETPSQAAAPALKPIDEATAVQFYQQAGGDRDKARELAKQAGYSF